MPSGDRTGPVGQGSMTGRSLGYCAGYDTPGFTRGFGGGMRRGFGSGRGMGRGGGYGRGLSRGLRFGWPQAFYAQANPWKAPDKEEEIKILKSQAEELSRTQKEIEKRLKDLEKGSD